MGANAQVAIVADEDAGTSFWYTPMPGPGPGKPDRVTDRTRRA